MVMLVAFCSWAEVADTTSQVLQLPDTLQVTVQQAAPAVADTIESGDSRLKKTIESIPAVELKEIFHSPNCFGQASFFLWLILLSGFCRGALRLGVRKMPNGGSKEKPFCRLLKLLAG